MTDLSPCEALTRIAELETQVARLQASERDARSRLANAEAALARVRDLAARRRADPEHFQLGVLS